MDPRRRLGALLVEAQENERRRIAWDLHDDSIQVMTAVGLRLRTLRRNVASDPVLSKQLDELEEAVGDAISRLRGLLFELRPVVLDREGLAAALQAYLDSLEAEGLSTVLDSRLDDDPLPDTRALLYRLAQEALTNVRRHAQASFVEVVLERRGGGFFVRIRDNGAGFTPDQRGEPGHLGLVAMRERAEVFGGWCKIQSAPGAGTTVEVWVPAEPTFPSV
jgi:signal transduction histidine kinase